MNTQAMNHDPHSPIFIRGKASPDKQTKGQVPPSRFVDWRRIIELALLLTLVVAAVYLISRVVTPQVVTIVAIIAEFLNEDGSDSLNETIEANYKRVKQEILSLLESEIERIKNDAKLKHLIKE